MRRALRRAWWALAAVVGLGTVIPAVRPSAAKPLEHQAAPAGTTPAVEAQPFEAPAKRRLVEIEVELAWLADPVTFPYHLGARLGSGTLHVTGYVQSTAEREHALQVARAHCPLEVTDELKIHAGILVRQVGLEPIQARADAENALREDFPRDASRFQVTCGPDGRLIVAGTINTPEEKLAVSRRLRHLSSCTAIVNRLNVVAAVAPVASPTGRVGAPPAGNVPESSRIPAAASPVNKPAMSWVPAAHWQPVDAAPAPAAAAVAMETARPTNPTYPAGSNTSWNSFSSTTSQPRPAAAATAGTEFRKPQPASTPPPIPMAPLLARLKKQIEDVCGNGVTSVNVVARSATDLVVQLKVRRADDAERLADKVLAMPQLIPYHVGLEVTMAAAPAAQARPATASVERPTVPLAAPHAVVPAGSFSVNVVPPLPAVPHAAPVAAASPALPVAARLKEQVEHACGTGARDVSVVVRSATDLLVQFKARNEDEGERLAEKVLNMPELAPYHLDLDVKVAETAAAPTAPVAQVRTTPAAGNRKEPARPDLRPALPEIPAPKFVAAPPVVPVPPPVVAPAAAAGTPPPAVATTTRKAEEKPVAQVKTTPAAGACREPARPDPLPPLPEVPAPKFVAAPPTVPAPPPVVAPAAAASTPPPLPPAVAIAAKMEAAKTVQAVAPTGPAPARAAGDAYVTTGVAVISEPAPEPSPGAPLPVRSNQRVEAGYLRDTSNPSTSGAVRKDTVPAVSSTAAGSPYASSGVVVRADIASGATASALAAPAVANNHAGTGPAPSAFLAAAHLKERIEIVCGSRAMDVRVIAQSATDVKVQLNVRNAADAQHLATKLTVLPELAAYHVDLQMKTLQ